MDFEDPEKIKLEPDAFIEEEEGDYNDIEQAHRMQNRFSLDVRRAIEDHLEENRLRKEFDYFFDEGFEPSDED